MFWKSIFTWLELAFWVALMAWGVFTILRGTIGGAIGIIAGLRILRHNTGTDAFRIYLRMIVIVQFTVLLALTIPSVRNALSAFLP